MSLVLDGSNGITLPATTTVQNAAIGAWVNFNGSASSGSATIRGSYNVTSVTINSSGSYTINFTNALPDANYSVYGCATDSQSGTGTNVHIQTSSGGSTGTATLYTTTQITIATNNASSYVSFMAVR